MIWLKLGWIGHKKIMCNGEMDWVSYFPNLETCSFEITSPKSEKYNCFAWANSEQDCYWSPYKRKDFFRNYYWPAGVPR